MFGISFEHILIVGVILIIVGPRKLPELGNTLGKAIKNFKDSIGGVEEAAYKRIDDQPKVGANNQATGAGMASGNPASGNAAATSESAENLHDPSKKNS